MQAAARCTPVVGRARRYRSQPLKTGPCARHPRRSRGCRDRGPHKRLANPRSLGRPGFPQRLQRKIGSALIKLEQISALRRCPPTLLAVHLPAARPRAREARQLPHVLLPPTLLRRRARRLGGAAAAPTHFAGPALDGAAGALLHAAVARALLLDPVAPAALRPRAPVLRLRTRLAAQGPGRGAAQGAANRLDTNAAGEDEEDQGSRCGRGCGAGMRWYQQVNNVWGVYNTSCPPGAPPELPSSTRQSLPAIIDCLCMSQCMHDLRKKLLCTSTGK